LKIIKRDYNLNGLLDPVYFNNPTRLRKELLEIEPFSAFIIFAKNHWLTVSNTNPSYDSAYGAASNWIVYDT
jgi:hypothetical protein